MTTIFIDEFTHLDKEGYCDDILASSIENAVSDFKRFYTEYAEARKILTLELAYRIISVEQSEKIKQNWLKRERQIHFRLFRSLMENDLC